MDSQNNQYSYTPETILEDFEAVATTHKAQEIKKEAEADVLAVYGDKLAELNKEDRDAALQAFVLCEVYKRGARDVIKQQTPPLEQRRVINRNKQNAQNRYDRNRLSRAMFYARLSK